MNFFLLFFFSSFSIQSVGLVPSFRVPLIMLQVGFFAAGCLLLLGAAEASVTQQDPGEHTASVAAVHQLTLAFLEESSTDGAAPLDVRVPAHKLWRLNVPGSASNNLLHAVEKGQEQPWKQRLQVQDSLSCSETNASSGSGHTGCSSYDFVLHGCDAATFRSVATSVTTAPQSQHADYSHLHKRFIPAHVKPGQKIRVRLSASLCVKTTPQTRYCVFVCRV